MKRLPAFYSILILIGPLLIIGVLMAGPFGCGGGGGGGATPVPTTGAMEIGFVASPAPAATPGALYQAINLNLLSVRLNPSSSTLVPDTDPNWVTITAPPGSGGLSTSEISVNLAELQANAAVFNTSSVTAQTYNQVELVVDPSFPGTVIPSCNTGGQEGCVSYPIRFTGSTNLRTTSGVPLSAGGFNSLILNISTTSLTPPASPGPGGNYTMNPTISVVSNAFLGKISGTVSGLPSSGGAVTAELTGTSNVIATVPTQTGGKYTMLLPAAAGFGTAYDLFASGVIAATATIDPVSDVTLKRGGSVTENFSVTANPAVAVLAGSVLNSVKQPIVAATVNLLLEPSGVASCLIDPAACVVVGTTATNNQGNYTLPSVATTGNYFVQAQATGFNTVTQQLTISGTTGMCKSGTNSANCSFLLKNTTISGNVTVMPMPGAGTNTVVQVMAEQHGTGNLMGLTQVTVPGGLSSAAYSIDVPTLTGIPPTAPTFDLIASAQDTYLGVGAPFPAHSLGVAANVPGGATTANLTVECLGHGSVNGMANSPDSGTHVRLFQLDTLLAPPVPVQLMDTLVGQTGTPNATQYSFCAPPGTEYTVQRFEQAGPATTPVPVGTQTPITVPTPAPVPTSTPCALCTNAKGQCPGNCLSVVPAPLLP